MNCKRNFYLIAFIFLLFVWSASAQQTLGYFKLNSDVLLTQVCNNCTYNNISYVTYPNLTSIISEHNMTKNGVKYSYLLDGANITEYGEYTVCGYGDIDGTLTTWCYNFFVNGTGRIEPSGSVLTFFIIAFLLICGFLTYIFIYSLGHAIKKDFDMIDLAFNWGIYFALFAFFVLQTQYLGSPIMSNILDWLIYVGAFTHVFASTVFLFISMMRASMEKKNFTQSGGMS